MDQVRHAEEQLRGAGGLLHLDVEPRLDLQVVCAQPGADHRPERTEGVEALGPDPLAILPLVVARADVVGAGQPEDVVVRLRL